MATTTVWDVKVGDYYKLGGVLYQRINDGPWQGVDVKTGRKINPALGKKVETADAPRPTGEWSEDSATDKQVSYLIDLGVYIPQDAKLTKSMASILIDRAKTRTELDGTGYHYAADLGL